MNDHRLSQLLHLADQASHASLPPDLAQRVRSAARRQQRIRASATLSAALLLLLGIASLLKQHAPDKSTTAHHPAPSHVSNPRAQLARLQTEAHIHLALAEKMWAMEDLSQKSRQMQHATPSPSELIDHQRQLAASIIVDQADRHLLALDLKEPAAKEYRQAIALFPQTRAADLARRRLDQLGYPKKG